MIPPRPPILPAPALPGPADSAVVHTLTNSRILLGTTLSTLDIYVRHRNNHFFSLNSDNYFFFSFFFSYPEIAYYTHKEVCCFNFIVTIIASRIIK